MVLCRASRQRCFVSADHEEVRSTTLCRPFNIVIHLEAIKVGIKEEVLNDSPEL